MTNDKQKDRLVELIESAVGEGWRFLCEAIADNLLANGVIVPPCDKVYYIVDRSSDEFAMVMSKSIEELRLCEIKDLQKYGYYTTKEEAEEALKEDK